MTGSRYPSGRLYATNHGSSADVREMYQAFPYPSPVAGDSLIEDVVSALYSLFGDDELEGKRVLDAGCGTGHRLLAVARRYPKARFVGLDMASAALDVARSLIQRHRLKNVDLQEGDLTQFRSAEPFDLIISTGVVHHLEDPCAGHRALGALLASGGILVMWHYHSLGEHQRLLNREILLQMWERSEGLERGRQLMREMQLTLETKRYGSSASQASSDVSQDSIDVDAYLHPIVNAYRFDAAFEMFRDCAGLDWAAINNVNFLNSSKLIDCGEVENEDMAYFCQKVDDLFAQSSLRERYRQLPVIDKLRVLELKLQPTGFSIVGGCGSSIQQLSPRVQASAVTFG